MRSSMGVRNAVILASAAEALSLPEISRQSIRRLIRRDNSANNVTIPAAISIAPSQYWDGNDGPWSSFPLQLGGGTVQTQNVRVMPSTASYNTWVIDPLGCPPYYYPDCANSRGFLYNHNESVTYVPVSQFGTAVEENLGLDTSGYAGYEDITLGWQGSGGPTVDHAPLFDIADSKYWIGIFGLNPESTNFTNLNAPQPSFMKSLSSNNSIPSTSYAYTAGNQYRFNKVYGSLTLGGYDQNRFKPTNVTFGFYEDISRDLLVNLKSIQSISSGSKTNLLPDGQISIYLDSTVPTIWLPESACTAFEDAFGISWNATVQRYILNGTTHSQLTKSNPTVSFTLANDTGSTVKIDMPYAAFDLNVSWPIVDNGTTEYYFPLMRAANDTQYTLGRAFFQEAYLIADYDRGNFTVAPCAWDQTAVQNTAIHPILSPNWTTIAEKQNKDGSNGSSGISAGAIAGVVIGVIAVIALLGLILFFIRRRKNRSKRERLAELEAKSAGGDGAKNSNDSSGEGKPFISSPMGGELGGDGEIHELTAPNKQFAQEMDSPHKLDPNKVGYSEMEGGGYFGPGKGGAHEMPAQDAIYEMPGSDVPELHGAGRSGMAFNSGDVKR